MNVDELPPFLRVEQVQELTQLGRSQIYKEAGRFLSTGGREGLPVVRFGRCLRFPKAALMGLGRGPGERLVDE